MEKESKTACEQVSEAPQCDEHVRARLRRDVTAFGSVKVLCMAAMLAAMGVVLGYLAKLIFGEGPFRITFENLPIIFGAMAFGPFVGGVSAVVADLCSCLGAGQAFNPLISAGALCIGVISGFVGNYLLRGRGFVSLLVAELAAHLVGSVAIKSFALYLYGFAWPTLLPRVPIYLFISVAEAYLLWMLFKNRHLRKLLEGVRKK